MAYERKVRAVGEATGKALPSSHWPPSHWVGGWHQVAVGEIKKLAAALARKQGEEEKEAARRLFQRLTNLLQGGNSALFLNRTPEL